MRLANVVKQLVDNKKDPSSPSHHLHQLPQDPSAGSASVPYFKFSDFQRAVTSCSESTGVILVCANAIDTIPHCIAHTALTGIQCVLLNDEVTKIPPPSSSVVSSSSSPASASFSQQQHSLQGGRTTEENQQNNTNKSKFLSPVSSATTTTSAPSRHVSGNFWARLQQREQEKEIASPSSPALSVLSNSPSSSPLNQNSNNDKNNSETKSPQQQHQMMQPQITDLTSEKSVLDVSQVKKATNHQILQAVLNSAREGHWLLLPEVSAIPLSTWTEIGKVLQKAAAASNNNKISSFPSSEEDLLFNKKKQQGEGGDNDNDNENDDNDNNDVEISPHFRFVTFLTPKSQALGRVLPLRIYQKINVVDTRGVVRHHQELPALFSSIVPLSDKNFSLLCIGIGDGRSTSDSLDSSSSSSSSPTNTGASGAVLSSSFGSTVAGLANTSTISSTLLGGGGGTKNNNNTTSTPRRQGKTSSSTTKDLGGGAPPTFFVDWPCAASFANVPVSLHSSDQPATSDYVDAALFALRETLLKALKEMMTTAARLDARVAAARKQSLESRAIRTGAELKELEHAEQMRNADAETNLSRLERNPAWIYPFVFDWVTSCAPGVNVEKLPVISHEELAVEDIVWLHEGIGDATACVRGTYQLSPVCFKFALPSVRPEVTVQLNNKLIVEGRTLQSIRHPMILQVFGLCELPGDLSSVQGGSMILRPLLSAAAMHERWIDAQQDVVARDIDDDEGGDDLSSSATAASAGSGSTAAARLKQRSRRSSSSATSAAASAGSASSSSQAGKGGATYDGQTVKQFALVTEHFEMSLEQCLISSFDRNKPWTVEQMLDAAVSILRPLVYLSDCYVHRAVCPANVVIVSGATQLEQAQKVEQEMKHFQREFDQQEEKLLQMQQQQQIQEKKKKQQQQQSEKQVEELIEEGEQEREEEEGKANNQRRRSSASPPLSIASSHEEEQQDRQQQLEGEQDQVNKPKKAPKNLSASVKLTCKLAQFGSVLPCNKRVRPPWLVAISAAKLPVRYCAPETFWGAFSASSDIWSFGVAFWSILHYCRRQPYDGVISNLTAADVAEGVANGTLDLPPLEDHFPLFLWQSIIRPCLERRPEDRPDARRLISTIMMLKLQHKVLMGDCVQFGEL